MTCTVVIPAAPGSPYLAEAVRSVAPCPVLVVSEARPDVPVGWVEVPEGAGFAARANAGIAAARTEAVLLLNDDAAAEPGALEALADALAGGAAVAGAWLMEWDGRGVQQAGLRFSPRSGRLRARRHGGDGPLAAVSGAALAVTVAWWRQVGGFDEGFHFYGEDVAFCLDVAAAGGAVVLVDAARVRHRGGGTRPSRSPDAAFHLGQAHTRLAWRLGRPRAARVASVLALGVGWSAWRVGPLRGPAAFLRGAGATWVSLRGSR